MEQGRFYGTGSFRFGSGVLYHDGVLRMPIAGWLVTLVVIASCRQLLGIDEPLPRDAGTRPIDAPVDVPPADASNPDAAIQCDMPACAAISGTCTARGCTFVDPNSFLGCSSGLTCDYQCSGANSCNHDLGCVMGATCTIECTGQNSCAAAGKHLQCQAGSICDLHCDAPNSCQYQITCGTGAICRYHCCDLTACNGLTCTGAGCIADTACP